MSNINCGIGVLHVKRQILTYFLSRHFSARSSFYVSCDKAYKEVSTKKYCLSFGDMTVPSKSKVPSL